ncbi:hypothetical protein LPSP5_002060 [Lacticaseibacillus paracasei]|uniref:hypothetical protein n=1 Tax=Lacticaseibacillus paracasei TaxID=1597 RepID=UPI0020189492|nr:hypothetical protein [Lacticaseibacillus paracasei]MCL4173991.1 hypothetical protein [Lacticaseibacillus paracasei]
MTKETKQDVFVDALRALEEFGEQGSSWEMAYDDLSARYAAASDGDTDCPYCHEPHKLIESELGNFLDPIMINYCPMCGRRLKAKQ